MRLINADELMENIKRSCMTAKDVEALVKAQPTAYDLDAIIQQLEDLRDGAVKITCCPYIEDEDVSCMSCYVDRAIEIVRRGGYQV